MADVFFSSDWHFGHKNLVRGTTEWGKDPSKGNASVDRTRDFLTLEEHNETLINNINNVVKEDDIVYCLGDFAMGGLENVWNFRKRLYCKNVHEIFGNHDHHIERNRALPNAHTEWIEGQGIVIVDGACPTVTGSDKAYIRPATTQEIFKSTQHYSCREINGQGIVMLHYSLRTWDKMHKSTWHLYGHSHGTLNTNWGKSMDVGIDTHPEFRPYHFDEIKAIMDTREVINIDHHGPDTN